MKNFLLSAFYAVMWFTIGTALLLVNNERWNLLGVILYVIGGVIIFLSAWYSMWDKWIEKTKEMTYLFDSAKGLDRERLDALLHALGLKSLPVQEFKTSLTITTRDHTDTMQQVRYINDLPVSPEKLAVIANGLINEDAPISRNEWVGRRGLLSDPDYRKLHAALLTQKLIEPRDIKSLNSGYILTADGRAILSKYALPSPTPQMEVPANQVI